MLALIFMNGRHLTEVSSMINWISVKESLPEPCDDSVLVCSTDGHMYNVTAMGFPKGGWDFVHIEDYFKGPDPRYIELGITHWAYVDLPGEAE